MKVDRTTDTAPSNEETSPVISASIVDRLISHPRLIAIAIGLVAVCVLWLLVKGQNETSTNTAMETMPYANEGDITKEPQVTQSEVEEINRKLASLSDRIDLVFEVKQPQAAEVTRVSSMMTVRINAMKIAFTELSEHNKELAQRISELTSRQDGLDQDVQELKVVKQQPRAKQKHNSVKKPPFQIDAIDTWDGVTYVAVSQAGRVAFLKVGEQQSGWTLTRTDRLKGQVDFKDPAGNIHSATVQR